MADITQPQPAKLICGMISADEAMLARAREELQQHYGPADHVSDIWPFDFTDYYAPQMGKNLLRQFLAFQGLIDPARLADIKRQTNALEDRYAHDDVDDTVRGVAPAAPCVSNDRNDCQRGRAGALPRSDSGCVARPINLDPGYLTPAKLVLASAKDFAHRVYLGGGIYAEVTLQYRGGWQKLDWTFPDYASGRYSAFMTDARNTLMSQLSRLREAGR